jgi:hypothetical protein
MTLSLAILFDRMRIDFHDTKRPISENRDKHPQQYSPVLLASLKLGSALHHHIEKPTGSPVGFFSPTPACLRGFPRVLADFAPLPTAPV